MVADEARSMGNMLGWGTTYDIFVLNLNPNFEMRSTIVISQTSLNTQPTETGHGKSRYLQWTSRWSSQSVGR